MTTDVLRHADICQPSYATSHGMCPRAVIEVVGDLLMGKMAFNALAGPAITLAVYSPAGRRIARCIHSCIEKKFVSLDKEMASIVMMLDIVLVMGFSIPWLLPLTAASLYLHACVFHWSVKHFEVKVDESSSTRYTRTLLMQG